MRGLGLVSALQEKYLWLNRISETRKYALKGISNEPSLKELTVDVVNGDVDPKKYWEAVTPEILDKKMNFKEEMRYHWRASLTQVAYFEHLIYEYQGLQLEGSTRAYSKRRWLELPIEMAETLGWGFYHWAFAEDFYGRSSRAYAERAKMGGDANSSKREDEDVLLRCLVKAQLEHHPQKEKGWPNIWVTSSILAKVIEKISDEQHLPIRNKGNVLMDEIFELLDNDKGVIGVYEKFSRPRAR